MTPRRAFAILYTSADASAQSGAFRCLVDMATEAAVRGHRVLLVVPERPDPSLGLDVRVRTIVMPLPRPRRGRSLTRYGLDVVDSVRRAFALARIVRRERVDVVHVNEILDVYGGLAARIARVPCVWHVRADMSSWPSALRRMLPRLVNALATRVVVVSASVRQEVFLAQGVSPRRVRVIHDAGPEPRLFHPGIDGTGVRRALGVAENAPLVVVVSKLVEPKGHHLLIEAAPKILAAFPNARFVIVGGEVDGEHHHRYAERLRRLPTELGIADVVLFAGYRDDVAAVMAAADVVVHPATHPDPFPGVILQAMAVGTAVVAPDAGGAREQVADGVSGRLVPMSDPGSLADAVCELLADADERARIGKSAAERVRTVFSAERFHGELFGLYAEVAGRAP
ncbi:MAG: glycosyltransferase family 4 protein [Actinomycetota bacterium]